MLYSLRYMLVAYVVSRGCVSSSRAASVWSRRSFVRSSMALLWLQRFHLIGRRNGQSFGSGWGPITCEV